jgi:hypothetical protein
VSKRVHKGSAVESTSHEKDASILNAIRELADWVAEANELVKAYEAQHSIQWKIGDWFEKGQERFGERKAYSEALRLFSKYKRSTLKDFAYVARHVESSVRTNDLIWAHHKLVARFSSSEYQKQLLDAAFKNKLSVSAFRKFINEKHPPTSKAPKSSTVKIDVDQIASIEQLSKQLNLPFQVVLRELLKQALEGSQTSKRIEDVREEVHV